MKNTTQPEHNKIRTTLYLTPENKQGLDRKKTALMNRAIADALKTLEKKENAQQFIDMLTEIDPVPTELSSEDMIRQLRQSKEIHE
jgi:DNA-binding MarR family transcriptional regulator